MANPAAVYELRADLNVDDGAVIYVNGQEAFRYNMPYSPVAIVTASRATGAIDAGVGDYEPENTQVPIRIPVSLLTAGANTIAVEVHQFLYGSGNTGIGQATDMRFNLQLSATAISPVAAPIALGASGLQEVRARVRSGTSWSPLTLGSFVVDTSPASAANLVVSEFLYDPAGPNAAEMAAGANSANDFEFIELMNISAGNIDMSGVAIENAIGFNFNNAPEALRILPPGARVLVVENLAAFNARWPGRSAQIAGVFASGNLSNGGELFTVRGKDGNIIREFSYDNEEPWPSIAGQGPAADQPDYSVVLNNPLTGPDHANPLNWRAGAASHGNPGGADSAPPPADPAGDANHNGVADILDYVFPAGAVPAFAIEEVETEAGAGMYPVMEITRNLNADGYTMAPESSGDLVAWAPGGAVWMSNAWNGDGTVTQKWRFADPVPTAGVSRRFLRLRLTTVP